MSTWRRLFDRQPMTLAAALLTSGVLLAAPPTEPTPDTTPLTAAQAWPHA